jgi:hypothetical protein
MGKTKKADSGEACAALCDKSKKCAGFHYKKSKKSVKCSLFKKGLSKKACPKKVVCCTEEKEPDPCAGLKKKEKKKCKKENA